jgi:hypothetical protein
MIPRTRNTNPNVAAGTRRFQAGYAPGNDVYDWRRSMPDTIAVG